MIFTKKNYKLDGVFNKEIVHLIFNKNAEKDYGFERIIFQKQFDKSLGIVIHTRNNSQTKFDQGDRKILYQYVSNKLNTFLIKNHVTYKNLLLDDISIMNWRASQPIGEGLPERLQLCEEYNIGFCGDWIQLEGYGSVLGAILSGLSLSRRFVQLY